MDEKLVVRAHVVEDLYYSGKRFIHLDLIPTDKDPTHKRQIFQDRKDIPSELPEGTLTFYLPDPLRGAIVFFPWRPD
jgi:hypothetical protein